MERLDPKLIAQLEELQKLRMRPLGDEELALRRAAGEKMDRLRVKVGRDFNVAEVLRAMRDASDAGLPDPTYADD